MAEHFTIVKEHQVCACVRVCVCVCVCGTARDPASTNTYTLKCIHSGAKREAHIAGVCCGLCTFLFFVFHGDARK